MIIALQVPVRARGPLWRARQMGYDRSMQVARPPWLCALQQPNGPAELVASEGTEPDALSRLRGMSPSQRLAHFVEACELARAILQHRADAREVLARRVPLSAEAEATWLRLCAEGRRARAA